MFTELPAHIGTIKVDLSRISCYYKQPSTGKVTIIIGSKDFPINLSMEEFEKLLSKKA